jgi:Rv2525c-like, glycoside hydrolase-like domain
MPEGLDTNSDCTTIAKAILSEGKSFVGRYYANSGKKRLSLPEAKVLGSIGLRIVALWEDKSPTNSAYFSYTKGVDDSTSAYHDALLLGQPKGSAIYFTIDFDPSQEQIAGAINDYFKGIEAGFRTASYGDSDYKVGVYGSGATCAWLTARGLASYSWLAMSQKWRGADYPGWTIKQLLSGPIAGLDVDADVTRSGDFGGFLIE